MSVARGGGLYVRLYAETYSIVASHTYTHHARTHTHAHTATQNPSDDMRERTWSGEIRCSRAAERRRMAPNPDGELFNNKQNKNKPAT